MTRREIQETQFGILLTNGEIQRFGARHAAEDRARAINKALIQAASVERVVAVTRTAIVVTQESGTWRAIS